GGGLGGMGGGRGLAALAGRRRAAAAAAPPSGAVGAPLPPGAATGSPPSRAAGAPSPAGAARWGRPALAVVLGVAALLPLVPRWPYPSGPDVTPPFFTTPAVQRLPPGTVVVTLPYPARNQNEALVWQAK